MARRKTGKRTRAGRGRRGSGSTTATSSRHLMMESDLELVAARAARGGGARGVEARVTRTHRWPPGDRGPIIAAMRREGAIRALRGFMPVIRRDFGVRRLALFGSTA